MSIHQAFNRTSGLNYRNENVTNGGAEGGPRVVDMSSVEMNLILENRYGVEAVNDPLFFQNPEFVTRVLTQLSNTFATH